MVVSANYIESVLIHSRLPRSLGIVKEHPIPTKYVSPNNILHQLQSSILFCTRYNCKMCYSIFLTHRP